MAFGSWQVSYLLHSEESLVATEDQQTNGLGSGEQANRPGAIVQRSTGPRTPEGKKKSARNSIKHGLLSKAVLLKGELRPEYESLLAGLREHFRPEGTLEELLVEKVAILIWRYRRLIVTERAEIQKAIEFPEAEEENCQQEEISLLKSLQENVESALIGRIDNSTVLERCLELLAELRETVQRNGFDPDSDLIILEKLYGEYDEDDWKKTLLNTYMSWQTTSLVSEDERASKGYASPAECKENFLEELDQEIDRLERYQKAQVLMQANRRKLESLCRNVPEASALERLLRYEANLERAFDRTLSQLERLQRMRLGYPLPPPVKVELSP